MPKFAANLSMLFNELPFMDRFAAARTAGFDAVEFLFPYEWPKEQLATVLRDNGLRLVLHNMPPGNWEAGERGIAILPGREAEFQANVVRALEYASALGSPNLHCMSGILPAGLDPAVARCTLLTNLRHAAAAAHAAGVRLLIEPINYYDIPGYFLNTTAQAAALIDEVGSDNLYIQYDIYHAQRMQGELANTMARYLPRIAHMQLADTPGRHEPGSGEINYAWLFRHIDAIGYQGWIGCEYRPATGTVEGLGWLTALN